MFQVGDKVFYPMHGAGIVEAIEEKEVLGEKKLYYILNMTLTDMQVMIPARETGDSILRETVDSETLEHVLVLCHQNENDSNDVHRQQMQRINMNKMKSGNIFESAEVIRDLLFLSQNKKLNAADKTMLDLAQQMLISELSLVMGVDQEQALSLIKKSTVHKE